MKIKKIILFVLLASLYLTCAKKLPQQQENPETGSSSAKISTPQTINSKSNDATDQKLKKGEIACIEEKLINPKIVCDNTFDEVCGCDGKTYKNSCEAKKKGVVSYKMGPCISTADY